MKTGFLATDETLKLYITFNTILKFLNRNKHFRLQDDGIEIKSGVCCHSPSGGQTSTKSQVGNDH